MDVIIPAGFEKLAALGKEDVIMEMILALSMAGRIKPESVQNVVKAILNREQLGTTGIMNGVGVPHVRHESVQDLICVVGRSETGVEFEALDGKPVFIFFLILGPKQSSSEYLALLAQVSMALKDQGLIKALRGASGSEEMIALLKDV